MLGNNNGRRSNCDGNGAPAKKPKINTIKAYFSGPPKSN
jgi:hypothetical protein